MKIVDATGIGPEYIKYYRGMPYITDDKDAAPIKIGSKVEKVNSEPGDVAINGSRGIVIGSISQKIEGQFAYTVVWEGINAPIGIIGNKIKEYK